MLEKRILPANLKIELPALPESYVVINKFDGDSLQPFMESCQKVLQSGQEFLPVVVDSYGGQVYTAFGMIDYLKSLDVPVITICQTKAMSCGSLLFSVGTERYASESSTFLVHEVSSCLFGKDVELKNDVKETSRLNREVLKMLDKNTGQKLGYWKSLVHKNKYADLYMTARQTKKHNLATHIGIPTVETEIIVERRLIKP